MENDGPTTGCAKLTPVRVSFGDVVLDADAMDLVRDGQAVAVEPQVMDVLAYLVRHRDRVVPKTELLASSRRGGRSATTGATSASSARSTGAASGSWAR